MCYRGIPGRPESFFNRSLLPLQSNSIRERPTLRDCDASRAGVARLKSRVAFECEAKREGDASMRWHPAVVLVSYQSSASRVHPIQCIAGPHRTAADRILIRNDRIVRKSVFGHPQIIPREETSRKIAQPPAQGLSIWSRRRLLVSPLIPSSTTDKSTHTVAGY